MSGLGPTERNDRRTRPRFLGRLKEFSEAARLRTFLIFSLASPASSLVASSQITTEGLWAALFACFSILFGLMLNDLEDAQLDMEAGKYRNPMASGKLGRRSGLLLVIAFLTPSLAILPLLNPLNRVLGLIVLFLFFTYSSGIRAKAVPVLDVAYHGLCLAILGVMGYTQQRPFNTSCLFLSTMIFLFSSISQIMQEVRDWEHDRRSIMTTVTWLGKRKSLALALTLLMASIGLLAIAPFQGVVPFKYLLLSPLAYFIITPIIRGMRSERFHSLMIDQIAFRGPIVMAILLISFLFLRG